MENFEMDGAAMVQAYTTDGFVHNTSGVPTMVKVCATKFISNERIVIGDSVTAGCVRNNNQVGYCLFVMILFSTCVQMAEGLHFGVVPYVSRQAMGIVSGMVGAGGNLGGVITMTAFFKGKDMRTDTGFLYLGIMVMAVTGLMHLIYFPDMGSMLLPKGGLGKYDPQLVKPPADYRGADLMDYSKAAEAQKGKDKPEVV